ncbi:MAG: FAD binding domain-containing protein [Anaerolineae bacterium]
MLRLPPFEYLAPRTLAEAVSMMADRGPEAMYVAGGTDLYPNMKRRQFEPKVLIGLRGIKEMYGLSTGSGLVIGADMTLAQVSTHPDIVRKYPALACAAGLVSSPPLRNMGTIGGNLCVDTRCTYYNQTYHWRKALGFCLKKDGDTCWVALSSPRCLAVSSSDCAPVAIALGAQVRLVGPMGERLIPAEALYHDDGMRYMTKAPDEILASIHLPRRDGWRMAYWKLRRRGSIDFPILGAAVALRLESDGTCAEARIVLGAVASYPVAASEAAALLIGNKITRDLVEAAAQVAYKPAKPLDNTDMALSYRKKMAKVYVAGALSEAAGLPAAR